MSNEISVRDTVTSTGHIVLWESRPGNNQFAVVLYFLVSGGDTRPGCLHQLRCRSENEAISKGAVNGGQGFMASTKENHR